MGQTRSRCTLGCNKRKPEDHNVCYEIAETSDAAHIASSKKLSVGLRR